MQLSSLLFCVKLDTLTRKIAPQSKAAIPVLNGQVIKTPDAQLRESVRPSVKKDGSTHK